MQHRLFVIGYSNQDHLKAFVSEVAKYTGSIPKILQIDTIRSSEHLQDALDNQNVIATVPMGSYNLGVQGVREKNKVPPLPAGVASLLNFRSVCVLTADPFSVDPIRYNVIRSKKRKINSGVTVKDLHILL